MPSSVTLGGWFLISDESGVFWFNWIARKFATRPLVYEPEEPTEATCPGEHKPEGWSDVITKKFVRICRYEVNFQQAKRNKILNFLKFYLYLSIMSLPALAVPIERFFRYGTHISDTKLFKNDDSYSAPITIPTFTFFGYNSTIMFVNTNGHITLDVGYWQFNSKPFPLTLPRRTPIVAAYWTDIDTRRGGEVFYRQSTNTVDLGKAEREASTMGWVLWALVATWIKVKGYYDFTDQNVRTLTFQCIMIRDDIGASYTIFNFYKLEWSRSPERHSSKHAASGFDSGDRVNFFQVQKSRTLYVTELTGLSNVHKRGRFVYKISEATITDGSTALTGSCQSGKWTEACNKNCQCHAANCHRISGRCPLGTGGCLPGMRGDDCQDPCGTGYYGQNCSKTCNCAYAYAPCDKRTGVTSCPSGCRDGWTGPRCTVPCPAYTFGKDCTKICHCYDNSVTCDNEHGGCPPDGNGECAPGWHRDGCQEVCGHGTFGVRCAKRCRCRNLAERTCDPGTGSCANSGGCASGWIGNDCQTKCSAGSHGFNCASRCQCKVTWPTCHHETGNCPAGGCIKGFEGSNCMTKCRNFKWGHDCSKECHCLSTNVSCNHKTGSCFDGAGGCGPGWTGRPVCEAECGQQQFGPDCTHSCNCKDENNEGLTCDRFTGACPPNSGGCVKGWGGPGCLTKCSDIGDAGKFGDNCSSTCHCREFTPCDQFDGKCPGGCISGWKTHKDSVVANCQEQVKNCRHGNDKFGNCKLTGVTKGAMCYAGWKGDSCQERDCDSLVLCNIHRCNVIGDENEDFNCTCNKGYKNQGPRTCIDINECNEEVGCGIHNCTNSMGSFYCTCKDDTYENVLPHVCLKKITRSAKKFKTELPFFPEDILAKNIAIVLSGACALVVAGSALLMVKTIIMSFLRFCLTMPVYMTDDSESEEDEGMVDAAEDFVPLYAPKPDDPDADPNADPAEEGATPGDGEDSQEPVATGARGSVAPGARGSVAPGARGSVAPGARGSVAPGARGSVAPGARGSVAGE